MLISDYGLGAQVANWEFSAATSVSDDGLTFAGYGFAPSGEQAAWYVRLPHLCPADLDGNHAVNGIDLALMLGQWTGAASYAPCPPPLPADLNGNCRVNGLDLALLLGAWTGGATYSPCPRYQQADLNHDCKVDGLDLALLLGSWG